MAGPAIRTWELAKALSPYGSVVVITPHQADVETKEWILCTRSDPALKEHFKTGKVLIAQTLDLPHAILAKRHGLKIILDAYDPIPLEHLELFKTHSIKQRLIKDALAILKLTFDFQMADRIICASEKQRDLWMGLLLAHKRLTPNLYDQDASLRNLIDVVPFGLSSQPPIKTGMGLKEQYGFQVTDKVILWGGGIWNWFDPLSLIRAMQQLSLHHPHIKLVFMGIKNPDAQVPEMYMSHETIKLAQELGLLNKTVFFNYSWVPYQDRQNFLLDADIGISTHFDHLETRYSFRTRMLDYMWAQLPILATEGDSFADLIKTHHLGLVVPYKDEKALAHAILTLTTDTELIQTIKKNLALIQKNFQWEHLVKPIHTMIQQIEEDKQPSSLNYQQAKAFFQFLQRYSRLKIQEKGLLPFLQLALYKLGNRLLLKFNNMRS